MGGHPALRCTPAARRDHGPSTSDERSVLLPGCATLASTCRMVWEGTAALRSVFILVSSQRAMLPIILSESPDQNESEGFTVYGYLRRYLLAFTKFS